MILQDSRSGKSFTVESDPLSLSLYKFKRICKGLDRIASIFGLQIFFLTLTLSDENLKAVNRDLNQFITFARTRFKRAGLRFAYVWAVELQKKRYRNFGKKALHWHFAIVCPKGALPDCYYDKKAPRGRRYKVLEEGSIISIAELVKRWGKGQVFCMKAYSSGVYGYLSKYFTKEYESLEGYDPEWSKLRKFGASQLGHYRFADWAYDAVEKLAKDDPAVLDMWICKEGARINIYCQESVNLPDGRLLKKKVRVYSVRSPYTRLDAFGAGSLTEQFNGGSGASLTVGPDGGGFSCGQTVA